MVEESYVSFETAKLLLEKGFNESCHAYWFDMNWAKPILNVGMPCQSYNNKGNCIELINCPTQQMAMRWLREVHYIYINITHHSSFGISFTWNVLSKVETAHTYEEACEAAIKYCLENLIG